MAALLLQFWELGDNIHECSSIAMWRCCEGCKDTVAAVVCEMICNELSAKLSRMEIKIKREYHHYEDPERRPEPLAVCTSNIVADRKKTTWPNFTIDDN